MSASVREGVFLFAYLLGSGVLFQLLMCLILGRRGWLDCIHFRNERILGFMLWCHMAWVETVTVKIIIGLLSNG